MFQFKSMVASAALIIGSATIANAGCGIASGNVSVLANDFPALHAVVTAAEACAGDGVTFSKNHILAQQVLLNSIFVQSLLSF